MTEFETQVLADLTWIKTQFDKLHLSNRSPQQPDRIIELESRMSDHEATVGRVRGLAGTLGAVLTALQLAIDLFFKRHL